MKKKNKSDLHFLMSAAVSSRNSEVSEKVSIENSGISQRQHQDVLVSSNFPEDVSISVAVEAVSSQDSDSPSDSLSSVESTIHASAAVSCDVKPLFLISEPFIADDRAAALESSTSASLNELGKNSSVHSAEEHCSSQSNIPHSADEAGDVQLQSQNEAVEEPLSSAESHGAEFVPAMVQQFDSFGEFTHTESTTVQHAEQSSSKVQQLRDELKDSIKLYDEDCIKAMYAQDMSKKIVQSKAPQLAQEDQQDDSVLRPLESSIGDQEYNNLESVGDIFVLHEHREYSSDEEDSVRANELQSSFDLRSVLNEDAFNHDNHDHAAAAASSSSIDSASPSAHYLSPSSFQYPDVDQSVDAETMMEKIRLDFEAEKAAAITSCACHFQSEMQILRDQLAQAPTHEIVASLQSQLRDQAHLTEQLNQELSEHRSSVISDRSALVLEKVAAVQRSFQLERELNELKAERETTVKSLQAKIDEYHNQNEAAERREQVLMDEIARLHTDLAKSKTKVAILTSQPKVAAPSGSNVSSLKADVVAYSTTSASSNNGSKLNSKKSAAQRAVDEYQGKPLLDESFLKDPPHCQLHGRPFVKFCQNCQALLCEDCSISTHSVHIQQSLLEAAPARYFDLEACLRSVLHRLERARLDATLQDEVHSRMTDSRTNAVAHVDAFFAPYEDALAKCRQLMTSASEALFDDGLSMIDAKMHVNQRLVAELSHFANEIEAGLQRVGKYPEIPLASSILKNVHQYDENECEDEDESKHSTDVIASTASVIKRVAKPLDYYARQICVYQTLQQQVETLLQRHSHNTLDSRIELQPTIVTAIRAQPSTAHSAPVHSNLASSSTASAPSRLNQPPFLRFLPSSLQNATVAQFSSEHSTFSFHRIKPSVRFDLPPTPSTSSLATDSIVVDAIRNKPVEIELHLRDQQKQPFLRTDINWTTELKHLYSKSDMIPPIECKSLDSGRYLFCFFLTADASNTGDWCFSACDPSLGLNLSQFKFTVQLIGNGQMMLSSSWLSVDHTILESSLSQAVVVQSEQPVLRAASTTNMAVLSKPTVARDASAKLLLPHVDQKDARVPSSPSSSVSSLSLVSSAASIDSVDSIESTSSSGSINSNIHSFRAVSGRVKPTASALKLAEQKSISGPSLIINRAERSSSLNKDGNVDSRQASSSVSQPRNSISAAGPRVRSQSELSVSKSPNSSKLPASTLPLPAVVAGKQSLQTIPAAPLPSVIASQSQPMLQQLPADVEPLPSSPSSSVSSLSSMASVSMTESVVASAPPNSNQPVIDPLQVVESPDCLEHIKSSGDFLKYFCTTCKVSICGSCAISGPHRRHKIIDVKKAVDFLASSFVPIPAASKASPMQSSTLSNTKVAAAAAASSQPAALSRNVVSSLSTSAMSQSKASPLVNSSLQRPNSAASSAASTVAKPRSQSTSSSPSSFSANSFSSKMASSRRISNPSANQGPKSLTSGTSSLTSSSSAEAGGALDDALEQQHLDGHEANQMTETYDEDFLSEPSTNFDFRFEFAWGSQGKFADTFSGPMGMAYDASSDVIFMSDSNNHRLQAIHVASQRMLWSWGVVGESGDDNYHFNQPRDCCLSPDHSLLYVVDSYNHRIVVLRAMDGQYLYQFGSKGSDNDASFNTPWAVMAVDKLLFVTDVYNHRVVVFQANVLGNKKASPSNPLGLEFRYCGQIGITGEAGSGLNTLNTPRGLAAYADRLLFIGDVKNARVQVFDLSTLSFVHSIGVSVAPGAKAEDGELMGPRGVAVDTKHKLLFVADTDQSSVVVFCASSFAYRGRIGPNINNSDVSASPELKLQKPKHVAIDSVRARIFVSDYSAHRVHVWQARPRK